MASTLRACERTRAGAWRCRSHPKDGGRTMNWVGGAETRQVGELRRLFTTFAFLVAKQGAVAVIGLAYWAVVTHLFAARDVGLAAAAASTALLLAAFGALGIPLLILAEIEPL